MIKKDFIEKLASEDLQLTISVRTTKYPTERFLCQDGKFYSKYDPEHQIYTRCRLRVGLCDSESGFGRKGIGHIYFTIVNASIYNEHTMECVKDSKNHLYESILKNMEYKEHETNWSVYGFEYPYQSFIIVDDIYIEKEYRNNGIASSLLQLLNTYVYNSFNIDTNVLFFAVEKETNPDKYEDTFIRPRESYGKLINFFEIAVGGIPVEDKKLEDVKYFYYTYDKFNDITGRDDE